MFEAGKPGLRAFGFGLALAGFAAFTAAGMAQNANPLPSHHRETNATHEARVKRTIADTYSHRWEVFGGGGYLRFSPGPVLKRDSQVTWNTSVNYFLNPKLSVVGDARGAFGNARTLGGLALATQATTAQINEYFFMGGVDYRFYAKEKLALSGEGLGGVGWGIFGGGSKDIATQPLGLWDSATKPAYSLGLKMDYNFYPNLAFRVTPTFVGTTFHSSEYGGSTQGNFGFNAGVVYRFGRQ